MGVNIYLQKKTPTTKTWQEMRGAVFIDFKEEDIKGWDSSRFGGDRDFASAEFEWEWLEKDYYNGRRPKDFQQIRNYLKDKEQHIQDRFNFALDVMEKQKDVYFEFNW